MQEVKGVQEVFLIVNLPRQPVLVEQVNELVLIADDHQNEVRCYERPPMLRQGFDQDL